jgi:predicted nucleic acid-binding protein
LKRYVLDTQLYVEVVRRADRAAEFRAFASAFLPFLHLHSVVAQELLAGATGAAAAREIRRSIVQPFEKRGRVIVPTWTAWRRSGEIAAELVDRGDLSPGGWTRSFLNDTLIAASLREAGATLITRNVRDFARIAAVESFAFEAPWPAEASR